MADRIASFLFDNATLIMPAVVIACLAVIVFLARKWPKRLWPRAAALVVSLLLISVAAFARGLLYAERNIRSIIEHRLGVLKLQPINGDTPVGIADLHGKIVVVNFWATWCPSCRAEMPDLNRLADQFHTTDVCILTITDETPERIALFQRKVTALRTVVATFESDQPHGVLAMSAYQGRPTTAILDREGRVQDIFIGKQSYDRLLRAIERQLRRRA